MDRRLGLTAPRAVRVKICGINTRVAFEAAREAGADYAGFVFFRRSPRCVTPSQAAGFAPDEGGPVRVGLFVAPTDGEIAAALAHLRLDILQLYADAERARAVRRAFGLPVWRAVGVAAAGDLPRSAEGADALLIEARAPDGATRPGGNAVCLDWPMLAGWAAPCPWVLAGGLSPANVAQAIRASGAATVDVSSGVESAPGVKDTAAIGAFVRAARAAHATASA